MSESNNCYLCDDLITTKNTTEEHIILNAIGGRLKSKKLICRPCNSVIGADCDAELAKQLNIWASLLNIRRHRGSPQPVSARDTKTQEILNLNPGGKPVYLKPTIKEEVNDDDTVNLSIKANSIEQARQILTGLKRKYPTIDVDSLLQGAQSVVEYNENPLHMEFIFGGDLAFRSVCKTAINFYIFSGGNRSEILHLRNFLKGEVPCQNVWTYYPELDVILDRKDDEILHSIIIIGNQTDHNLYAYIEFFSSVRFIVLLNEKYNGESISFSYFFDTLASRPLDKQFTLNLSRNQIMEILTIKERPYSKIESVYRPLVNTTMKKQSNEQIEEMIERAMTNSFKRHPEGIPITKQMTEEFVSSLMKEITPWLSMIAKNQEKE